MRPSEFNESGLWSLSERVSKIGRNYKHNNVGGEGQRKGVIKRHSSWDFNDTQVGTSMTRMTMPLRKLQDPN